MGMFLPTKSFNTRVPDRVCRLQMTGPSESLAGCVCRNRRTYRLRKNPMVERMRPASHRPTWFALLLGTGIVLTLYAGEQPTVTLQLKNGDRLTGQVLSEDDQRVVLSTPWNVAIFVPKSEIKQQTVAKTGDSRSGAATLTVGTPTPSRSNASQSSDRGSQGGKPIGLVQTRPSFASSIASKRPRPWRWNLKLGIDFSDGAKSVEQYFARTSLTYTRNYRRHPKKFLRDKVEYSVDYGKTDGQESANRMLAGNKLDFDIGSDFYGYAAVAAGYDKVREIESQYEAGPGAGYHLLAEKTLALDAELGLNYQDREGLDSAPDREVVQARVGNELTWELAPKITLSEQVAVLPFLEDPGEYQIRAEGNVGFGIVRYLSLNLTVRNLYDTLPAPGVPNNEFQVRSSLGVTF